MGTTRLVYRAGGFEDVEVSGVRVGDRGDALLLGDGRQVSVGDVRLLINLEDGAGDLGIVRGPRIGDVEPATEAEVAAEMAAHAATNPFSIAAAERGEADAGELARARAAIGAPDGVPLSEAFESARDEAFDAGYAAAVGEASNILGRSGFTTIGELLIPAHGGPEDEPEADGEPEAGDEASPPEDGE